jgi:CBS domain-containing protein
VDPETPRETRFFNPAAEENLDPTLNLDKSIRKLVKKNPLFISPTHTLGDVAKAMAEEKKDIAVVKDKKGEVQGIVTSHDLFDAMRTWVLQKDMLEQIPSDIRELKVTSIMKGAYTKEFMEACGLTGTNVCITLGEDDTIANAVRVMAVTGLDHILISGEGGVTGTLSDDDLVKAFVD